MLDQDGTVRADAVEPDLSEELALKIYGNMIRLEAMDDIFYNAQRQVWFRHVPCAIYILSLLKASLRSAR